MIKLLLLVAIGYFLSQAWNKLSNNAQSKTELQSAIDDAKSRLPNTGLFQFFKEPSSRSQTVEETAREALIEVKPIKSLDPKENKAKESGEIAETAKKSKKDDREE